MPTYTLAELTQRLAVQLRDETFATWSPSELDDLVTFAVADLYPLVSRPILPSAATVALTAGTYYYSLPSGVLAVSRIDLLDSSGEDLGPMHGSAWEIVGDVYAGTAQVHVAPAIAATDGTLKMHGYGTYDASANPIVGAYVPLVLAIARAEAYRRVGASRERFKAWLARNQVQNISTNELLQMVNEADREAERLRRRVPPAMQKPVPGRQG